MTINTISTLPVAPARTDAPAIFVTRADAFLAALVVMQGELNTSIGQMNTDIAGVEANAISAAADAASAASSAAAAESASNATLWVSGQSYVQGDVVYSPIDFYSYRAKGATSGTTDPSLDSANWQSLVFNLPAQTGNTGKVLTTDGSSASWQTPSLDLGNYSATFKKYDEHVFTLGSATTNPVVMSVTKQVPQTNIIADETKFLTDTSLFEQLNPFEGEDAVIAPATINNASYTNKNDTSLLNYDEAACFANDGSFLYIAYGNQTVYKYPLTTPYDIGTIQASVANSGGIGGQFLGFFHHPSEDIIYIANTTGDLVEEFSTVSMSKTGNSFYVGTQTTSPRGISFSTDGTKMYVGDTGSEVIFQYTLSTAWDITTASYDSVSLSCSTQDSNITDFHFLASGKILYVVGATNNSVFQYTLGTAWDLSTASFTQSFSFAAQMVGGTYLLLMPPIPDFFYIAQNNFTNNHKYSLSAYLTFDTAYSSATIGGFIENSNGLNAQVSDGSGTLLVDSYPTNLSDLTFTSGNYEFNRVVAANGNIRPKQYVVGAADLVTTWSYVGVEAITGGSNFNGLAISPDTTTLIYNITGTGVYYSNRTDTGGYINGFGTKTLATDYPTNWIAMGMSNDGLYIMGRLISGDLTRYTLNVPWRLDLGYVSGSVVESTSLNDSGARDFCWTHDGLYLFQTAGTTQNQIWRYRVTSGIPYDVTNLAYEYNASSGANYIRGISISKDNLWIIASTESNDRVYYWYNGLPLTENTTLWSSFDQFILNGYGNYGGQITYFANDRFVAYYDAVNSQLRQFRCSTGIIQPNNNGIPYVNDRGIDTTYWQSLSIDIENPIEDAASECCFAVSVDGRETWVILSGTTVHSIARNNAGTWEYNSNTSLGSETWAAAPSNTEESALATAISTNTTNDNWTINVVKDSDWNYFSNNVLADSLDIAIINDPASNPDSDPPASHGDIILTFTANTKEQGALIGIDYDFDQPAGDKVRFSALENGTYKIRIL